MDVLSEHGQSGPHQTRAIEPLLVQCWSSVYDAGPTLNQQWLNGSCLLVSLEYLFRFQAVCTFTIFIRLTSCSIIFFYWMPICGGNIPTNTKHLYNIGSTLTQRLRRWSNIAQMFCICSCLLEYGHLSIALANTICWPGGVLMLGRRRRQRDNIKSTLGERLPLDYLPHVSP